MLVSLNQWQSINPGRKVPYVLALVKHDLLGYLHDQEQHSDSPPEEKARWG